MELSVKIITNNKYNNFEMKIKSILTVKINVHAIVLPAFLSNLNADPVNRRLIK